MRHNNLDEKGESPSLVGIKNFDTKSFVKHTRVLLKSLLTVRQQIFYINRDIPLLGINFFDVTKFFWNIEGFLCEMFWYCETKQFGRKTEMSTSYPYLFSIPEISEKLQASCTEFSHFGEKKILTDFFDTSSLLLSSINFLDTGIFLKHSSEVFPYEVFRYCDTKRIRQKIVT